MLGVRSVLWVVLMPGTVTGLVPWRYFGLSEVRVEWRNPVHWAGLGMILLGVSLLATCIWEFAHRGRGTLSPIDPPRELVVHGLYRYVRNPMYLSVGTILLGEFLLVRSTDLLLYVLAGVVVVNVFVLGYEEPYLRRRFGENYLWYAEPVGRWIPSLRHRYHAR